MKEQLLKQVSEVGFSLFGVADPAEFERYPPVPGISPDAEHRPRPRRVWSGCRSVVVVGLNCQEESFDALVRLGGSRVIFYSEFIGHRLHRIRQWLAEQGCEARMTEEVSHKRAAVLAGLGHVGRNTLVAHPEYGSNLRFGVLLTDAELPFDEANDPFGAGLCRDCRRCERACPAGAIADYAVKFSRCVIPAAEGWLNPGEKRILWARRIQGRGEHLEVECNLCQKACPLNEVQ